MDWTRRPVRASSGRWSNCASVTPGPGLRWFDKKAVNLTAKQSKTDGQRRYDEYWAKQMADPDFRRVYEEEAAKKELWLQLAEAREAAGLTQTQVAQRLGVSQAQVARLERKGYDAHTLNSLRRYVEALGEGFSLEVRVRTPTGEVTAA